VFIDPSQNDYTDTLAAVYSARSFHLPTVSTPLDWKEITSKLNPQDFTIETIVPRIKKKGELFAAINDVNIARHNSRILNTMDKKES
jgi:bifunctional non-homologous end joining protein LigD